MDRKKPVSCGFLVVRGQPIQSFLLMKHPKRWDLPKGHVDPGETDLQCALRELAEETGIEADAIEVAPEFLFEHRYMVSQKRYGGKGTTEKILRIFLGRLTRPVEILLTEHDGYEWFDWSPPHQIQEQTIDPLLAALDHYLKTQSDARL
ncbi:MAG: NUDIX domain-containing protein [Planctomycetaceae bacterium]|nr:NUDIX domain-containing protein [Planctomycetaceae bacterium]